MESGRASKRRRVSLESQDKLGVAESAPVHTPTASKLKNGSGGRSSTRKNKKLAEATNGEEDNQYNGDKHGQDNGKEEEAEEGEGEGEEEEQQESNIRSSGRQRRKPKRYESDDGTTIIFTPTQAGGPKQATKTPSKRVSSRKSSGVTPHSTKPSSGRRKGTRKPQKEGQEANASNENMEMAIENPIDAEDAKDVEEEVETVGSVWDVPISPQKKWTPPKVNGLTDEEKRMEAEQEEEREEEEEVEGEGREDKEGEEREEEERLEEAQTAHWPQDMSQHAKIKSIVLEKLAGKRAARLVGVDEEYKRLHRVVEQTVMAGEGNSLLLIGARGTGKTALINSVLTEVGKENREQFHIIRLNGFLQTDDKTALREIWRQLGKEMETEDEHQVKNYADTLSTLLATLSHSSELASGQDADFVTKSVIFVLDEFDLFASHPRQTLLYNLFDIAQSRKAPIAVIGVTTKVDIAESLEKRVKSRFSHRYIHLGLPKTLQSFLDIYKSMLQIQSEELEFDERATLSLASEEKRQDSLNAWNCSVDALFQSAAFKRHASRIYYTTKSIPEALTAAYLPVAMLDQAHPFLAASAFTHNDALGPPDSKLYLLPSLPTLSLALLIVAARLDVILDSDVCNFNMAYEEYSRLAARARVSASASIGKAGVAGKVWGKEVAKGAWEKLVELKLLMPTTALGGMGSLSSNDMMRCDVALEEIAGAVGELDRVMEKWCREI